MKQRDLITGMVGSHLADFLLANTDWDIFGMCRWRSPLDNVAHLLERAKMAIKGTGFLLQIGIFATLYLFRML